MATSDQLRPADTSIVDTIFQVRAHKRGGSGSSCTVHSLEGGHHISIAFTHSSSVNNPMKSSNFDNKISNSLLYRYNLGPPLNALV